MCGQLSLRFTTKCWYKFRLLYAILDRCGDAGQGFDQGPGAPLLCVEVERTETTQPGWKDGQRDLISVHKYLKGGWQWRQSRALFSGAQTGCNGHQLEHMGSLWAPGSTAVLCSARALAQVAQRLWGLLLRDDVQKPPGHGPGPPALGVPAGAEVGQRGTEDPASLSHSVVLWKYFTFNTIFPLSEMHALLDEVKPSVTHYKTKTSVKTKITSRDRILKNEVFLCRLSKDLYSAFLNIWAHLYSTMWVVTHFQWFSVTDGSLHLISRSSLVITAQQ